MVSAFFNPNTKGASEFNGLSEGFSTVASNNAAGNRRRYEQDLFEQALLDSVDKARAEAAGRMAEKRASRDDLDLWKFKYQMFQDDRQYAMDQEKHRIDMGLSGGELNAKNNIGSIIQGGNAQEMASAFAFLGQTDPTTLMGMNMYAQGASDEEVARMQAHVGGKRLSPGESLSVEGQKAYDIEKLMGELVQEQFKTNLKQPEDPKPPKQYDASALGIQRAAEGAARLVNPALDEDQVNSLISTLDPEVYNRAQQAAAHTLRTTNDETLAARAFALEIGNGSIPGYRSGALNPFVGPGFVGVNEAASRLAPTAPQVAVDNLLANPTMDNINAFRRLYGDAAYAQIAGE